ncbi:Sodium-dependent proline transporter [Halotydeus destructor]|nr:Sodium-dependent proline transporter [Halotydeus destructor]
MARMKQWLTNLFTSRVQSNQESPSAATAPCPPYNGQHSGDHSTANNGHTGPASEEATSPAEQRPTIVVTPPVPEVTPGQCHTVPSMPPIVRPPSAQVNSDIRRNLNGIWTIKASSFFACFLCCCNFYTLSRFSVLAYFFKGTFMVQFLILSLIFGLPVFLFLMSVGQYLGTGYTDIWFISPAFKGIGYAFMATYTLISIYSSVPIAWLFVYFRDSFLATRDTPFRWAYCSLQFNTDNCIKALNVSSYEYVGWSVSSYLHGKILSKHSVHTQDGAMKLDTVFNLVIVWTIVFLSLYKGLHGAGRQLVVFGALPVAVYLMVSFRFIESFGRGIDKLFEATEKPFLLDGTSWLLAARETFIVWIAFGAAALSVCSHNKASHNLLRQAVGIFALVIVVLFLSSCCFASAMEVLVRRGLIFSASSFGKYHLFANNVVTGRGFVERLNKIPRFSEKENDTSFVKDKRLLSPTITADDFSIITGANLFLGENLISVKTFDRESHYAILRFATEIYPAALAVEGPNRISSFWSMSFYLSAIMLNLGFLIVLVGTLVDAIVSIDLKRLKAWKSTIAFVFCIISFSATLPMTTPSAYYIIYFMDFCFASLWWLSLLYLLKIIAILIIRGRPIGTENLVQMLVKSESTRSWFLPLVTFHWNLIVPVTLMIVSVCFTKSYTNSNLTWTQVVSIYPNFPVWAQWLSIAIQVLPLLLVFVYGVFQVTFYLVTKQGAIYDRLQHLFCPTITTYELQRRGTFIDGYSP